MAYQMAAMAVTLNDLEGHSVVAGFSNAVRHTFVQHFTRFQLTVCSHGFSALAQLLVQFWLFTLCASLTHWSQYPGQASSQITLACLVQTRIRAP